MTAEPLHHVASDPEDILQVLPKQWHEQFLSEYHAALDAAHEVWRFRQLRDFLHLWRLRAAAFSHPDFDRAAQDARAGRADQFVAAGRVLPGWVDRT